MSKDIETPTEETPPDSGLNIQQELFCRYYTQNTELFGHATSCYSEAYNFKLEELDQTREKDAKGKEIAGSSEYDKAYHVCSVNGARLLRNADIQRFITKCLNELLRDEIVDRELAKVILQDHELGDKVAAIKEYNKLKKRITEKLDVTSDGKVIGIEYLPPVLDERSKTENQTNN